MALLNRDQLIRETGAEPSELDDLESKGLLVPHRRVPLFGWVRYSEEQLQVARKLLEARHALRDNALQPHDFMPLEMRPGRPPLGGIRVTR